jgi:hypothetical protein
MLLRSGQFPAEKALLQPGDERRQNKTGSHTLEANRDQSTGGFAFNYGRANPITTRGLRCERNGASAGLEAGPSIAEANWPELIR